MPTLLFFDDWLIQERRNLVRRWFSAEPWPDLAPATDPLLQYSFGHMSVLRDGPGGSWRMWSGGMLNRSKGDLGVALFLYESSDGLHWLPHRPSTLADPRTTQEAPHLVFSGEHCCNGGSPFRDDQEADPTQRYKMAYLDIPADVTAGGICRIAASPDGIRWQTAPGIVWLRHLTDTCAYIVWNPYTRKYQFTSRPIWGDRRVALYQTRDWRQFEEALVVLHPDADDGPMTEFYGMPQFFYEGWFIGFLWKQHCGMDEWPVPVRMKGTVDCEPVYSINGINWNRMGRQSLLPDRGLGREGFRNEYPSSMVLDDEGWLRIYTSSGVGEHADGCGKFAPGEPMTYLTVSRLRRDGFCALETRADEGWLILRPLRAGGGTITVNAVTGKFGKITAELRGVPDNKPLEGYELAHSIPVSGDGHCLPLRWKGRQTIDPLKGRPFRLYLRMDQARLYAVRLEGDYFFSCAVQKTLAGDYERDTVTNWWAP